MGWKPEKKAEREMPGLPALPELHIGRCWWKVVGGVGQQCGVWSCSEGSAVSRDRLWDVQVDN